MRSRIAITIATLAFVLVSCGGGDGGEFQDKVADQLIENMQETGFDVDADCVRDATNKLSDADAKLIFDAGPEGDAVGISDSAAGAATALLECLGS